MSSFLYRLGQAAARHRWRTLGIWIAAVVAIFVIGGALGGKFSDDFNLPDSESQRAYDLLAERYPAASGTSAYIVFHATDGPLEDQADAVNSTLDDDRGAAARDRGLEPVRDPGRPVPRRHDRLRAGRLRRAGRRSGRRAVPSAPGERSTTSARPTWRRRSAASTPRGGRSPRRASSELIGLLAAMIILLIAFGSVVAMGLPIGTAVIGLATGTGLTLILAAFASVPEFATILSSMIGLGVGIDYALFIVTRYRQNLHDGMDPLHAIGLASATAGQAVVFSGHHRLDRAPRPVDLGDRVRRHDGDRRGDRRPGGRRRGRHAAARVPRLRGERDRQAERPPQAQDRGGAGVHARRPCGPGGATRWSGIPGGTSSARSRCCSSSPSRCSR